MNAAPLRPITGETFEGGIKTLLLDNLSLNIASWHTTRNNADLNNRAFLLTQVGQETSKGAEINLIGQITEAWSAVASYSYTDVRLSDPAPPADFDGNRQRNVPYNSANFWTRYNVIQTGEHTFGVGLGLVYVDSRPGDLANTFLLPSYGRWDGGLSMSAVSCAQRATWKTCSTFSTRPARSISSRSFKAHPSTCGPTSAIASNASGFLIAPRTEFARIQRRLSELQFLRLRKQRDAIPWQLVLGILSGHFYCERNSRRGFCHQAFWRKSSSTPMRPRPQCHASTH